MKSDSTRPRTKSPERDQRKRDQRGQASIMGMKPAPLVPSVFRPCPLCSVPPSIRLYPRPVSLPISPEGCMPPALRTKRREFAKRVRDSGGELRLFASDLITLDFFG